MIEQQLSPGTQGALLELRSILGNLTCKVDVVLINSSTLIRNSYSKDFTIAENRERFRNEVVGSMHAIVEVMGNNANIKSPTVILYAGNYFSAIKNDNKRPFTEQRKIVYTLTEEVIRNNHALQPKPTVINNVTCYQINVIGPVAPAAQLWNIVKQIENTQTVLMLSHIPMDWYLCKKDPAKIKVIESYHGKIKTLVALGVKLFKKPNLPLHPGIHALLGDKDFISPSIGIKEKRRLYELAEKEMWGLKTSAFITESLKKHGFVVPFQI